MSQWRFYLLLFTTVDGGIDYQACRLIVFFGQDFSKLASLSITDSEPVWPGGKALGR